VNSRKKLPRLPGRGRPGRQGTRRAHQQRHPAGGEAHNLSRHPAGGGRPAEQGRHPAGGRSRFRGSSPPGQGIGAGLAGKGHGGHTSSGIPRARLAPQPHFIATKMRQSRCSPVFLAAAGFPLAAATHATPPATVLRDARGCCPRYPATDAHMYVLWCGSGPSVGWSHHGPPIFTSFQCFAAVRRVSIASIGSLPVTTRRPRVAARGPSPRRATAPDQRVPASLIRASRRGHHPPTARPESRGPSSARAS